MKKIALILIPLLLAVVLMACDFSSEGAQSNPVSDTGSSVSSQATSQAVSNDSSDPVSEGEGSQDPNATVTITDIPVVLAGVDELKKDGYTADSSFYMTVDVEVYGARETVVSLTAADIEAFVDVSGTEETGDIEFFIDITVPEGVALISASESFATVKISRHSVNNDPVVDGSAYISNGIIISGTRGMEQFGAGAGAGQSTAAKLNEFKAAVGDVNVYILPAPLASAFYAPEKYSKSIDAHKNCFEGMRDALVDVKYIDTLSALAVHKDEDIYARTDHHWNALGAYYAAEAFAQSAGVPFANISTFTVDSFSGYVGTMYGYSKAEVIKNNPETFVWYIPSSQYTVTFYSREKFTNPKEGTLFTTAKSYTKFISGDAYTTKIESNVGNGRKLLLFKDSYGNALAPFLVSSFDEVIIADFRYFNLNAKTFITEQGITDVCFEMSAFSLAGSKRNNITRLINN